MTLGTLVEQHWHSQRSWNKKDFYFDVYMDHMCSSSSGPWSVVLNKNIDVCETLMPPFPNISRIGFTFDLSPTDLNINRGHLINKDFLLTKFEVSGAKHSWFIDCTRCWRPTWPLTLTFDLLTWQSIGIIYSSRTIYLPSLKLLGQSVLELLVAQGVGYQHNLWPWPLTYWPEYQ